jgi:hypothetical protein
VSETPDLQLDRAEFDGQHATTCGACAVPLTTEYFEANGTTVCRSCCEQVRAIGTAGSSATRALRAFGAGVGAAVAGSILYYAILALTGYEFGLIAIVVGMAVGKAVNWGAYGRGGWRYQTMAIALTYVAIVSSYVPLIFAEAGKEVSATATAASAEAGAQPAETQSAADQPPTASGALIAIVMLTGLVLAIPFLGGAQNIIGLIIIGIGLYEAWKFNRKPQISITGPHAIAAVQAV